MMKKLHVLLTLTLISFLFIGNTNLYSQNSTECFEGYTIGSQTDKIEYSKMSDVIISWDFTQVTNRESINLEFEIQPLNSCWKALEGSIRSELVIKKISSFMDNFQGDLRLKLNEYDAKCFKWRARITNTNNTCVTYTDWRFSSFL